MNDALNESDLVDVGRRIRALRVARGMRQADLAGDSISVAYVSRIESGERRPTPAVLRQMADRLGTTPDHLTSGVDPDRAAEAQLRLRQAELAVRAGRTDDAAAELAALVAEPAALRPHDLLRARVSLAGALERRGDYDGAIDLLEQVRRPESPLAAPIETAIALSRCYRESGDLSRAIDVGERELERLDALGLRDDDDAIRLEVTVAGAYFVRGDLSHAGRMCREAAARAEHTGSPTARASAYWNASFVASERGETRHAVELADRAIALLGEGDDDIGLARLRGELGLLMLADGDADPAEAASVLRRARGDAERAQAPEVDLARFDLGLARCALLEGDLASAERLALSARRRAGSAPTTHAQADVVLGRIANVRGDMEQALDRFRAAAATLTGIMADRSVAQTWYELGELLAAAGDAGGARDAFRSAAAAAGVRPSPDAVRAPMGLASPRPRGSR
jgi:transcriptional regulator with XRE-family HTH domain/ATP/maltotriose-dependent transcriptional regulator MalT